VKSKYTNVTEGDGVFVPLQILLIIVASPQVPGSTQANIIPTARRLQKDGVQMYSVGAGPRFKQAEVLGLASYADYVRSYNYIELPRNFFNPGKYHFAVIGK